MEIADFEGSVGIETPSCLIILMHHYWHCAELQACLHAEIIAAALQVQSLAEHAVMHDA